MSTPFQPPTSPEIPAAPFEIPTPNFPPADYVAAGNEMATGAQKAGIWDNLWSSLLNNIAKIVATVFAVVMGLFTWFAIQVAKIFLVARQANDANLAQLAAVTVSDLFGISASQSSFSNLGDPGSRGQVGKDAAEKLMEALGGTFNPTGTQSLTASGARAETYLTTMINLCIEGWLEGWMMEALSAGQLETFSELKDILASALGLGRMTHAALSPALKILVTDPFLWLINSTYHPNLYKESTAVRQYLRGQLTIDKLQAELGYQGWDAEHVAGLINEAKLHLSVGDIQFLWAHSTPDEATYLQMLADQGYDDATAHTVIQMADLRAGAAYNFELAKMAIDAWAVGTIIDADLDAYFNAIGISDGQRVYLNALKQLKSATKRKQLGLGQAETMVKQHIWDLSRFQTWAAVEGYTPEDEQDLELLLFGEITTADQAAAAKKAQADTRAANKAAALAKAAAKAAALIAAEPAHGVSIAKYETLVLDNIRRMDQYQAFLTAKGISQDNQDALVALLQNKIAAAQAVAATKAAKAAKAAQKNLNLGELDKGLRAGVISLDEYTSRLTQAGFDPTDVQIMTQVASDDLNSIAAKAQAKTDAKAAAAVKHVDLTQEENAVRLGLQSITDFQTFLTAHGFATEDAAVLVSELQAQLTKDQAAQATKAAAAAKATNKGLSLPNLEKAVRAGTKTIDDYRTALAGLGYGTDAQDSMVSLLQLQMQTDQQNLAAKGTAAGLLGQRGVSVTDLERAVKVGTVPISTYTTALNSAGMNPNDVQLLTTTLAAQVSASKKAAKITPDVAALLKAAGLSYPALQAAVVGGTMTLDDFQTALLTAGVDADTVSSLAQVASDAVGNAQAIAAKRADATALAGAAGLSLAQEEAAVKAGTKTIADYQTFLAGLNFDPADIATLSATLQAATVKKTPAAKTPKSTPAA